MYYYSKSKDCFYGENIFQSENFASNDIVEYTDEEYEELWNCDAFHFVAQDPVTKLPCKMENTLEEKKTAMRKKRERECFPVINRGQLWYSRLTDAQKAETDAWYNAWLDVTATFRVPDRPEWLS